jgi:Poly(ADP-ribose) polymerase and DNA-Ligase Zn-finger region
MAHTIEAAKSGRASCRSCKKPIAKGELRFGEETLSAFAAGETTYQWHHLLCAAQRKPSELKVALDATTLDIPDRAALDKEMADAGKKVKPGTFPYAEHAPSGRSKCLGCDQTIDKGLLRVAIEREVDTGSFVTTGAGYLHVGCAKAYTADKVEGDLLSRIKQNSPALSDADVATLTAALSS